jgi:hypothetical protein
MPMKYLYISIYSGFIHNGLKWEKNKCSSKSEKIIYSAIKERRKERRGKRKEKLRRKKKDLTTIRDMPEGHRNQLKEPLIAKAETICVSK